MLLRLIPPAPLPTILFTLSFPTLPDTLPLPTAWENHLQLLVHLQLTAPPSLHALDKSVAWTALLDTVTFDLVSLTVTCRFVDGVQEEWPLTNRCVDLLESVIRDVSRSATEADNEYAQERRKTEYVDHSQNSSSSSNTSLPCGEPEREHSTTPKPHKPKKRRSILASLVASLVPSSTFSGLVGTYRSSTPPVPPPPPPPIVIEDSEPLMTHGIPASRYLRRRARSTLVDAYRRFVVGELTARFRTGDPVFKTGDSTVYRTSGVGAGSNTPGAEMQIPRYALWVTRSTMRRVAEEMARVIDRALYANGANAANNKAQEDVGREQGGREDERDRDGDDSGSASSITDGSSVHTPLDCHDGPLPTPSQFKHRAVSPQHTHTMPHTPTVLTPQAYHAYISLKDLHHRLHNIACQLTGESKAHAQAAAVEACGAEVKSRRRAWSSRQYLAGLGSGSKRVYLARCGSAYLAGSEAGSESGAFLEKGESLKERKGVLGGASIGLAGLAVPVRSSPLCRMWSAEDLEDEMEMDARTVREGGRPGRWEDDGERECEDEKDGECEDEYCDMMVRRARSLCAEQEERRRSFFGMTGRSRSCEAEDMHGHVEAYALGVDPYGLPVGGRCVRPRALNMGAGGEEGPFGVVYATGPARVRERLGLACPRGGVGIHDEVLEEDEDEDGCDGKDMDGVEDGDADEDTDVDGHPVDDGFYEKRSEEEFIIHHAHDGSGSGIPGLAVPSGLGSGLPVDDSPAVRFVVNV